MGAVLSSSRQEKRDAVLDGRAEGSGVGAAEGSIKKQSVLLSLPWKNLIASSAKKKSVKKVNPKPLTPRTSNKQVERLNNENNKKSQPSEPEGRPKVEVPLAAPTPTTPTQTLQPSQALVPTQNGKLSSVKKQPSSQDIGSPRQVIIQASTGELLHCLGDFVRRRCSKLKGLSTGEVILWFRNVDRTLLLQGWQDYGFITPANLVFVYLLCKDTVSEDIESASELQGTFLSCLYLAYSYMGNEISYPLSPFMIEANKEVFWDRSLTIIDRMSGKMLQLNSDPHFFTEVFQELKDLGETAPTVDS